MKRRVLIVAVTFGFLTLLSACSSKNTNSAVQEKALPNLVYYTIGTPDTDLNLVNKKVNELLSQKIGITLSYQKIGWEDYSNRLNAAVSAGVQLDIAFADNYTSYVERGAWLALDSYLKTSAQALYKAVNPILWEGVTAPDGKIYGVPTNKEVATQPQWMYPKDLVEKYGIDITTYNTLESLEPLFAKIKAEEPDYTVMELNKDANNFFEPYGYTYLGEKKLPFMVQSQSEHPQVVNIFETDLAKDIFYTLRKYYQAGYINEDAALRDVSSLEYGAKTFWKEAEGGPLAENSWSKDRGYAVVSHAVGDAVVTTESTRGAVMAVNADSDFAGEAVRFLTLLNTDVETRNLFNYGIQDVHYTLSDAGQILLNSTNEKQRYTGITYTQGNWFILKTLGGAQADPQDKWKQYEEYNSKAAVSNLLGFTPDLSQYPVETVLIRQVWDKYYPALMTGSVEVDTHLEQFLNELRACGVEEMQEVLQQQIDAWLASREP